MAVILYIKKRALLSRAFFLVYFRLKMKKGMLKRLPMSIGSPSILISNYQTNALVMITSKINSTKIAAGEV